jgi:hypothetical protein
VFNNTINGNKGAFVDPIAGFMTLMERYLRNYVNTVQPVEVSGVNDDGTVNVKSLLRSKTTNGQTLEPSVIYNIPVLSLQGNNCSLMFDVSEGNQGILIAGQFDITEYKKSKTVSDKPTSRTYSYSDGFYLPMTLTGKQENKITISYGESSITLTDSGIDITAGTANITADTVNIAGGVNGVARVGDKVEVEITSGSSAGTWDGTIKEGSEKVLAG